MSSSPLGCDFVTFDSNLNIDYPYFKYSELVLHIGYLQTVFALYFLEVRLSFSSNLVPEKLGKGQVHFLLSLGAQGSAKFSISFVVKYPLWFSLQEEILIYYITEIFENVEMAFNFLFIFSSIFNVCEYF